MGPPALPQGHKQASVPGTINQGVGSAGWLSRMRLRSLPADSGFAILRLLSFGLNYKPRLSLLNALLPASKNPGNDNWKRNPSQTEI